jgi:hypothetical protein
MTATGLSCGSCGAELNETAKFCSECGAAVSAGPPQAEYKQVTVLFADVVRSMDIAAAVDVERQGYKYRNGRNSAECLHCAFRHTRAPNWVDKRRPGLVSVRSRRAWWAFQLMPLLTTYKRSPNAAAANAVSVVPPPWTSVQPSKGSFCRAELM